MKRSPENRRKYMKTTYWITVLLNEKIQPKKDGKRFWDLSSYTSVQMNIKIHT